MLRTVHGTVLLSQRKHRQLAALPISLKKRGCLYPIHRDVPLGPKATHLLDGKASVDTAVETLLEKDSDAALRQIQGRDRRETL